MPFSSAQLKELDAAVKANNLEKIDALLKPHWKFGDYNCIDAKYKFNYIESSFLTACRFELKNVIEKYLELRTFNKITLSDALYGACKKGSLDIVKLLIEKGNADPNEPYDISLLISKSSSDHEQLKSNEYPLKTAIYNKRDDVIKYLVSLKKLDINKLIDIQDGKHDTYLLFADIYNQVDTCKLLLEHGANPLIQTTYKDISYSFHTKIDAFADHFPDKLDTAMLEMYSEWLSKNKHREHELNVEAARIAGKHYSEPHSSGSNSPASAGSPDSSPPRQSSPLLQKTPPESPAASRNGSPPNSPIHKSDSGSSGSAGSSPEKTSSVSKSSVTPQQRAEALIKAMDGNAHRALSKALSAKDNDFEVQKILFDQSKFKFMDVQEASEHGHLELLKYMIEKYPEFTTTSCNRLQITALHESVKNDEKCLGIVKYLLDKGAQINAQQYDGDTPLHLAAYYDSVEIVKELLKRGADPLITNKAGYTPLQISLNRAEEMEEPQQATPLLKQATEEAEKKRAQQQLPPLTNLPKPIAKQDEIIRFQELWLEYKSIVSTVSPPAHQAPNSGSKQIGSMYVSPPPSVLKLPAKNDTQNLPSNTKKDSSKSSVGNKLKKLFG